jgi:hypothetical protein
MARITAVIATPDGSKQFRIVTLRPEVSGTSELRTESVGRIDLCGLDGLRSALAEHAVSTAEATIRKHMGSLDCYARVDGTSFLLWFGSLSEAEASLRIARIGRAIRKVGEKTCVRSVAAKVRFADQGQSAESLRSLMLEALDGQLGRIEEEARQTLRDAMTCASREVNPVLGRDAAAVAAWQIGLPAAIERRLVSALAALPREETNAFDLNGLRLKLAAGYVVAETAGGDPTPLMLTLSFDIFATRAATERFFAVCAGLDSRVTDRLILLLSALPAELPRTRLHDCVSRLRPYCRGVGFEVEDLADLAGTGLPNSFNPIVVLPAAACKQSRPDRLKGVFLSLQGRRVRVMIRGADSEGEASALLSVGADMVTVRRAEE